MKKTVRIALVQCSLEEEQALKSRVSADWITVGSEPVSTPEFDFAVIGSGAVVDGTLSASVAARVTTPVVVILPTAALYATFDRDVAAVTICDLGRLDFVIHRELRLQTALREATLYRRMIDTAAAGVWAADARGQTRYANPAMLQMLARTAEDLEGRQATDFVRTDEDSVARRAFRLQQEREERDLRLLRNDGSHVWTRAALVRLSDDRGNYDGAFGFFADITDRKRAEDALAEREAQLSFAHELARLGGWEWDSTTERVTSSPELAMIFGTDATGNTAKEWIAAITPDDVPLVEEAFRASVEEGIPLDVRFRICRNGMTLFMHARARRVGGDGEPVRLVGVTQDITTEMLAQNALRDSEARYRTLVEHAKDIIVSMDTEGRIRSLNRAFEEVTGWTRGEWIGKHFFEALDPQSLPLAAEQFSEVLAGKEYDQATEYILRRRDGSTITVEAFGRAVDSGGPLVETVVVARDVTARKEADARAEKEKRLASLGQLATSVAHEFNNVLMSIMPFAELLQRRLPDDDRVTTSTEHILQAIRRGREISREILRFARPVEPEMEAVTASDWLEAFRRRAEAMLGPLYKVTVEMSPKELAFSADPSMLDQVASNLTLNARDAMPEGGSLHVAVREEGESVAVEFTDTGVGIEPDLLERIFEPLFSTKRGGNGLGLTFAHQAMVQQNGSIHARSTRGEGTTMTLKLSHADLRPAGEAVRGAFAGGRILIVEDDESVGEGLSILLTDEGFLVRLVERGLQAAKAAEEFSPDLVLLDVNLPDISGVEVYDILRARWPDLAVIFSTGHADARALSDVQHRKVPAIMKPYDFAELMALVATISR